MITNRRLSRRTVLRGLGATISLPFLDAMVPAAGAAVARAVKPVKRLGYVFIPMGSDISRWTPEGEGKLGELSPILKPLEGVKDSLSVISNLELQPAYPGTHATSNSAFLSAARAKRTESSDYFLGITADQIAAKSLGQGTRLPSMEVAMDLLETVGQCDNGYACVYQNNLSWSSPTTPLPAEAHPRLVFEMLFGEGGTAEERAASLRRRASLLDSVKDSFASLKRELGTEDRVRVDEYLEAVRDVEKRIQRGEADAKENPEPDMERPMGVPIDYQDHARLMFDLQLLAFQGDITRVSTFQMARETSNRTYPETGVTDPHHPLSHHGNDPEKIEKMSRINRYHVSLFAEFVEKLRATPEGDSNLLENSLLLYGSGMGNPNVHDHTQLPIVVAGGAAGGMQGGRHVKYDAPTPLANLHLTLLDKVGVDLEKFGDSNGQITELFEPLGV
ncbi:MAG: DUF1552 domain-containing protein [Verrucomicrobiota bacterium]